MARAGVHKEKEMQRLVHWQVKGYNPLMSATCGAREREGERLLKLTDEYFLESGISLKAVLA